MSTSTILPTFMKISKASNYSYFPIICDFFKNKVALLYGDQSKAIDKIEKGKDRVCEIMFIYEAPMGFIVYKTDLKDEFGLKNGFELKTLALFRPELDSGRGFGSLLYNRVDYLAKSKSASYIFCTVNVNSEKSIKCLLKNNYKLVKKVKGPNFLAVKNL